MKTKQILTAGAIALSMILTGCSASSTETKDTKTTEVTKKKEVKTLGKKTKDSKSLKFTNITGKKITVFETKSSSNKNNSSSNSSKPSSKPSNSSSNNSSTSKPSNNSSNNSGSSKPSNNSGSNSSNSKPAEHTHNWVAQYKTVNVPEKGHNEQVLVKDAYDEPTYGYEYHSFCNTCGLDLTANGINDAQHVKQHMLNGEGGSTTQKPVEVQTGTIHHEAVYETRYVVDSPATTKQELTGYKCSTCGKTKAN